MSDVLKHYYLETMGIALWTEKTRDLSSERQLMQLEKKVSSCVLCPLSKTRSQTVFARGNAKAPLMIIGEAPGFYEDKQGLPFVGKAGFLLNHMMKSIGMTESDFYIANVLKCRPPNNRDPFPEEIVHCSEYLTEQIKIVSPRLILALGRFAGQFLLKKNLALNQLRNQIYDYQNTPFLVTYHPAYLLRNPKDKRKAYSDLLAVKNWLNS